jgi:hypothetical protein
MRFPCHDALLSLPVVPLLVTATSRSKNIQRFLKTVLSELAILIKYQVQAITSSRKHIVLERCRSVVGVYYMTRLLMYLRNKTTLHYSGCTYDEGMLDHVCH